METQKHCIQICHDVWEINNFLTTEECDELINYMDEQEKCGKYNTVYTWRWQGGVLNMELQNKMLAKIQKILPECEFIECSLTHMVRYYEETCGTPIHRDSPNWPKETHSLAIYLNDDYEDGETVFYNALHNEIGRIIPKKGNAAVYPLNHFHAGIKPTNVKYFIQFRLCEKYPRPFLLG